MTSEPRARVLLALGAGLTTPLVARADPEAIERPPLAEPIFTESVTDLDGYQPGEIEFDVNGYEAVARRGGSHEWLTSVEAEWKLWSRLGLRVEPSFARSQVDSFSAPDDRFGFRAAAGWNLVHDFEHDFHLQVEAEGRFIDDTPAYTIQPGEAPTPFNADLKAGIRAWGWTVRGSVGTEAGDAIAHAPVRLQIALMHPTTSELRFGLVGLEADADFARQTPLVVAPNLFADMTPIGLPARLGVAIPVLVGAADTYPAVGLYVRLLILTSREAKYESQPKRTP